MASRSPKVQLEVIGTHEFQDLVQPYGVVVLPKIWINDRTFIDGGAPDDAMMERALVLAMGQSLDPSIPPGKLRMGKGM